MNNKLIMASFLLVIPGVCISACVPDSLSCINTIMGQMEQKTNYDTNDGYSYLFLNGKEIYKTKTDYIVVDRDNDDGVFKSKKYFITRTTLSYTSGTPCAQFEPAFFCNVSVVLDLTSGKPVISNGFTSKTGDSHIDWVSWGKVNSIIVFKDNSKFKYSNGHVEYVNK